jgi:hypothetical protein
MKIKVLFLLCIIIFPLQCSKSPSESEKKGKVFGYIWNNKTKEVMPKVNIYIYNSETLSTDAGYYEINNIDWGIQSIEARCTEDGSYNPLRWNEFKDSTEVIAGYNHFDIYMEPR